MTGLLDIRDAVQQVSEAIASVLDIDVIISDADFRKIGDTKKHYKLEVKEIKEKYVIGGVIKTGVTQVIGGKTESEHCLSCGIQENCNLEAMICVPIRNLDQCIGAIGLIAITESSRKRLLENQKKFDEIPPTDDRAFSDYLVLRGAVYREEAALQWIQECIKLGEQRSAELKK